MNTLYFFWKSARNQPGFQVPAPRKMRKWMNETGVPPEERDRLPLLAAGSEVVWVCGAGFADGLAPTADSENVLQMEAQKMEEQQ